ncbi:hypothetical protein K469DRAFT_221104 [Zopfia rhizophila CBS 207.26]|uniref:Uncharacterized protein n=1 Tax=Zopfia rhizophila CBS 207.26 TaxID=1314779 RepID=A0A6A6DYV1_9PEZI|nr:hypothetical protein K469DRAFT_221104 [Zopfia rhizophila CBS 207.26]
MGRIPLRLILMLFLCQIVLVHCEALGTAITSVLLDKCSVTTYYFEVVASHDGCSFRIRNGGLSPSSTQ